VENLPQPIYYQKVSMNNVPTYFHKNPATLHFLTLMVKKTASETYQKP